MDRTSIIARNQSNIPLPAVMPRPTTMTFPTLPGTSMALSGLGDTTSVITPESLVQRLPSIVNPEPVDMNAQCGPFTEWVSQNAVLAAVGLAALAYFALKGKR